MTLWKEEELMGVVGASEYLGHRVAYSLKEVEIRHDILLPIIENIGLSRLAPKRPNYADVFRRVTGKIRGYYRKDEYRYKVEIIHVNESDNPIERVVMVVEVDEEQKEVSDGRKVAKLTFDRNTNRFEYRTGPFGIGSYDYCPDFVEWLIRKAQQDFEEKANILSPQQVRDLVRNILTDAGNPVQGISSNWNIPATREEYVQKLKTLAEKLNEQLTEPMMYIDTLPVVNTKEQRKKISADAVAFALQKMQKLLHTEQDNIVFAKNVDKAKERAGSRFREEAERVMSLIEEYETLIGEAFDEVRQAREITEKSLKDFCSDPIKQAEHKRQIESDRKGRKIRAIEDNTNSTKNKPQETKRKIRTAVQTDFTAAPLY